jgi:hemerythrin-like domain-containing protein
MIPRLIGQRKGSAQGNRIAMSTQLCFATGNRMSADTRFPGFSAPAAGFEAPLEMLAACHGRIEQHCATLRRLAAHLEAHGADARARSAAAAVLRYFDTAAPVHHADEEQDLFPALIESMAGSDAVCLKELTARLTAQHRELDAAWEHLRGGLAAVAAGTGNRLPADAVESFVQLNEQHLALEDGELLPMAARLISDSELQRIGRAMRERRGITNT